MCVVFGMVFCLVQGWVGFGISDSGGMVGADIVTATVQNGNVAVSDWFSTAESYPTRDTCADWKAVGGAVVGSYTVVELERKLATGDSQDLPIMDNGMPTRIIVAKGDSDTFAYHGSNRRYCTATCVCMYVCVGVVLAVLCFLLFVSSSGCGFVVFDAGVLDSKSPLQSNNKMLSVCLLACFFVLRVFFFAYTCEGA